MDEKLRKLLCYGIPNKLAEKAVNAGLGVTTIKATSQKLLVSNYGLLRGEAKTLSNAVKRQPIDPQVAHLLLERSNFVCNACKGTKSSAYIIHHIEEYETSQDNSYQNLIVLCPNDHDLAHRRETALTLKLTPDQLRKCKTSWENKVEITNTEKAAQSIDINDDAIDYINANRIEELCHTLFRKIPRTSYSTRLKFYGILDSKGSFDQKYVRKNLSNGAYLFDYMNKGETHHYKELMQKIATKINFIDLSTTRRFTSLQDAEGKYAFFVGGVSSTRPNLPVTSKTPAIVLRYRRRNVRISWPVDPNFLMSMSAISRMGGKQRYIIYCLVRSVIKDEDDIIHISASPLLFSFPNHYVHRKPSIAHDKEYDRCNERGLVGDDDE
jgi:hypothetical protein